MCPDWELNRWPVGLQAGTQSTEPHQPGQKWDFSLWVFRKFAGQHAGTSARELKDNFQKIRWLWMHVFLNNKYEFKMDGHWVHLLASPFSLILHGSLAVLFFVLYLHIVLRMQGTSLSNASADNSRYVFNTVLLGMTGLLTIFMIRNSQRILLKTCWYDGIAIACTCRWWVVNCFWNVAKSGTERVENAWFFINHVSYK